MTFNFSKQATLGQEGTQRLDQDVCIQSDEPEIQQHPNSAETKLPNGKQTISSIIAYVMKFLESSESERNEMDEKQLEILEKYSLQNADTNHITVN